MPFFANPARFALTIYATVHTVTAQNSTAGPPWVQSEFGYSPPVYPSRTSKHESGNRSAPLLTEHTAEATGLGWEDAFAQASAFIGQMTLEEKVMLATGTPGPVSTNTQTFQMFKRYCRSDLAVSSG